MGSTAPLRTTGGHSDDIAGSGPPAGGRVARPGDKASSYTGKAVALIDAKLINDNRGKFGRHKCSVIGTLPPERRCSCSALNVDAAFPTGASVLGFFFQGLTHFRDLSRVSTRTKNALCFGKLLAGHRPVCQLLQRRTQGTVA